MATLAKRLPNCCLKSKDDIEEKTGVTFTVTGIATGSRGIAINPNGINLAQALELLKSGQPISQISSQPVNNSLEFVQNCSADVLFETIPVNYDSGQPAVDLVRSALELGMHVTTANKGPVVHAYDDLTALAKSKGIKFYFESAVMDGAPVFSIFRETLPAANITAFRGVLNSTTNLILSRMESGESYADAVDYAQSIGIAETDPSGDVDGWDAAIKVCALATVLMGVPNEAAGCRSRWNQRDYA